MSTTTLQDQIKQVIDTEPVVVFIKGTPEAPACGNSMRALQALWQAGRADHGRRHPSRPAHPAGAQRSQRVADDPAGFVKGELIGGADITEELKAVGRAEDEDRRGARRARSDGAHGGARAGVAISLGWGEAAAAELDPPARDEQRQTGKLELTRLLVVPHRFPGMLADRVAGLSGK